MRVKQSFVSWIVTPDFLTNISV